MGEMIYFAQCGALIKIGRSVDVKGRIHDLECGNPFPINVLGTVPGDREDEEEAHKALGSFRVKREWFRDCEEVRAHLRKLIADAEHPRERPSRQVPCADSVTSRVIRRAKQIWASKVSHELSLRTGMSRRQTENWVSGRYEMSADALADLLRSEHGFDFLEAVMEGSNAEWWPRFRLRVRVGRCWRLVKEQGQEIKRLGDEAAEMRSKR